MTDEVLTASQVAAELRLPLSTVYHHMAEGTLPAFRIGKCVRVRRSRLEEWIADQEGQSARRRRERSA